MNFLITGNLGYVGPGVIKAIRKSIPGAKIIGYDIGYFARNITTSALSPDAYLDVQYYGDVRDFKPFILKDIDVLISLAAISNDPIGNKYEKPTMDINYVANVKIAEMAKQAGVKRFVFASSCSVYGAAEDEPRKEHSPLNPLTAYAKSKIRSEEALDVLSDNNFQVTCLRFATACGMSERLRLDLVLNDFVAGARSSGLIDILSDGTPWRPLINVDDMARALIWASQRASQDGGSFLTVNTGSNSWNYQVKDLAYAVKFAMPSVEVQVNENAAPDKRSYRVNFDLFKTLAPDHQPMHTLEDTIHGLIAGLQSMNFTDTDFRQGELMRLNTIKALRKHEIITPELRLTNAH
ncbi:MAG: SDR family oxidoreductase [Saprospiraceae bacterium]|nr:SDR family oxidoreductase [Saprospiraceae bacterium]